ncbi:DUF378 domain-containing protein [Patescibacteria group bacterium]|nr:DUF378 domain-containing protein [Patescibacteria group bacterium]MBU1015515.1 DUF378 domain-containing protein [Patescibacteria group bacterium]MBU1685633.1 DUF378 domain-containing protein [Patescibacteria group bacterium]MBU1938126.1 DUF378 domain-containing protein [Patescibacteria group bacterium]
MKGLYTLAMILVVVGAINWGLIGLGGFLGSNLNVVNMLVGSLPTVESIVYLLVGVSGLWVGYEQLSKK